MPNFQFKLDVRQTTRCKEIDIYDITGVMSDANPSGYDPGGILNPSVAGVAEVLVKITSSTGFVYNGSIYSATTPFPNISNIPATLNSVTMGEALPDGETLIEATAWGPFGQPNDINGQLSIFTGKFFLTCNVNCCVKKLRAAAAAFADPCESKEWKAYLTARAMYEGLLSLIECKDFSQAKVVLAQLKAFCLSNGSNCGC